MPSIPIIEVKNLYKIYKVGDTKVHALDGVERRGLNDLTQIGRAHV